jgi:hypothetical protein
LAVGEETVCCMVFPVVMSVRWISISRVHRTALRSQPQKPQPTLANQERVNIK